ncbi:MAG: Fur family transcriptional regulator [Sedimentibacter sp.]|uniref:Fur family transcriptional regulator n=1 Tax=Sedimentibacter sp. TaxID=1960295 RepID=UPI0031593CB0
MKITFEDLLNQLKKHNIRLSHQRLKVLEYLVLNQCHPTVDNIYSALHDHVPTLSKTTVYNTLNSLSEAGIVRAINIDDNELRYDINTHSHGHFKCQNCNEIYDFVIDIDSVETSSLNGFEVRDKNVYFKGMCPKCSGK